MRRIVLLAVSAMALAATIDRAVAQPVPANPARSALQVHAPNAGLYCGLGKRTRRDPAQQALLDKSACDQLLAERKRTASRCALVPAEIEARCAKALGQAVVRRPWIAMDINPVVADKRLTRVVRRPDLRRGVDGLSFVRLPFTPSSGRMEIQMVTRPPDSGTCPNKTVDAHALGVYSLLKPGNATDVYNTQCTLTRIAHGKFLTAAHCLEDIGDAVIALTVKTVSNGWNTSMLSCATPAFPASEFGASATEASKVDVAVCSVTGGAVPAPFSPARLLTDRDTLQALVSQPVFMAGLGRNADRQIGLIGYGDAKFSRLPDADGAIAGPFGTEVFMGAIDGTAECAVSARGGDSGGAVYDVDDAASRRLLGIISRIRIEPNERTTFFIPLAKRAPCRFLQEQGALPAGADCALTIE